MNREANTVSIPIDLIPEILLRLPAKSIRRFRSVSKQWESILRRPYFTELFRTRSSSNPRLLIGVVQGGEWYFFSTPQLWNQHKKSSLVVAADFHMKISKEKSLYCSYASGLIYFLNIRISKEDDDQLRVVCNPSTGQYTFLPPEPNLTYINNRGLLGFDPIGKQYKVLVMNNIVNDEVVHRILTLRTEKKRWRKIQCPLTHIQYSLSICISGVLYYTAQPTDERYEVIVCFDVRSEKFKILYLNSDFFQSWSTKLINYKGKLGVINLEDDYDGGFPYKLFMWVLEDVHKQTWSTCVYTLKTENNVINVNDDLSVVGATATGEIVLANENAWKPFSVFYFNPERNTLRSVEIQGVSKEEEWNNNHLVYFFVDHVEDLQFDIMKTTYSATSIRPPVQNTSTSSIRPPGQSTSTSSIRPPGQSTSTSSKEDHKVRTESHQKQDRLRFESVNKFDALSLLDDD